MQYSSPAVLHCCFRGGVQPCPYKLSLCTNYPIGAVPQTPFPAGLMVFVLFAFHAGSLRQMGCAATRAGYATWQDHFDSRLGTLGTTDLPASRQLTKVRQKRDMGSKGRL